MTTPAKANRNESTSAEHVKVLGAVEIALEAEQNVEEFLDAIALVLMRHVADAVSIDLVEDDGSIASYVVRHSNLRMEQRLVSHRRNEPLPLTASYGYPRVIKTGKSQLIRGMTPRIAAKLYPNSEGLFADNMMVRSFMCLPLLARGRTLGALSIARTTSNHPFTADNLLLMEKIAEQLAKSLHDRLQPDRKK